MISHFEANLTSLGSAFLLRFFEERCDLDGLELGATDSLMSNNLISSRRQLSKELLALPCCTLDR